MLASASFLSIGFFEASTPGTSADPSSAEPDTEVVMKIHPNHQAEMKLKGKRNETITFNLSDAASMKKLEADLQGLKTPDIKVNQILVSADDTVDYSEITALMGHINKSNLPVIVGEF